MISKIEWNDGMSVGVESIDNDHKTLIYLIDALSNAIESGKESEVLERLFDKLADYASNHFRREEALIESCDYHDFDDHKKQHDTFSDKVPELKAKLLSAGSVQVALEVNLFLYQWLLNHILVDDMAFFNTLVEHGYVEKSEDTNYKFSELASKISRLFPLRWRLLYSSLIPIVALILLGTVIVVQDYSTYKELNSIARLSPIIKNLNIVSQQIQKERGLTIGYVSSQGRKFQFELIQQRAQTDSAVSEIIYLIEASPNSTAYSDILALPSSLESIRVKANKLSVDQKLLNEDYTSQIMSLIGFLGNLANLKMGNELSNRITAIVSLSDLTESIGQERALGVHLLEAGVTDNHGFASFDNQTGRQQGLFQIYMQLSKQFHTDEWSYQIDSNSRQKETIIRETIIRETIIREAIFEKSSKFKLYQVSSLEWFKAHSDRITDISIVIAHLSDEFNKIIKHKQKAIELRFKLMTLFLLIILIVSALIAWILNRSIMLPISKITDALSTLAKGQYDYRFTSDFGKDEINTMIESYEYCRLSLLKSEVKSSIRFQRKDINLLSATYEKEIYAKKASIDSLTGAINRRKFAEISNIIMSQAQRYNHSMSIMMLDIDFFKQVNDTYGHSSGDIVLQEFVQVCQKTIRETDVLARVGGEEFIILMPETKSLLALELGERIRKNVSELSIQAGNSEITVTVSIGVSKWINGQSVNDIEALADKALYQAKNSGRNCVVEFMSVE